MILFEKLRWMNLLSTGNQFTEIFLNKSKSTLIVGENGAGKTTFLDALSFALYGKPFRDINLPQLINSITNKGMLVEVEFKIGSHKYEIKRGMKPKRFEIYRDGQLVPPVSKDQDQQQMLEQEILKISYKSFKQVIVLGSTNYTPFMTLKDKERRGVIEDLLDIQVFSLMNTLLGKKRQELISELNDLNKDMEIAKSNLAIHNEHLDSLHSDKETLIKDREEKRGDLDFKIAYFITENDTMLAEQATLQESIADQSEVDQRSKKLISLERSLEDRLAGFKKHIHFYEDNDECPTCTQAIDADFKHLTVEQYKAKSDEFEKALKDVDSRFNTASERLSEISAVLKQINDLNTRIASNNVSIRHHNEAVKEIEEEIKKLSSEKKSGGASGEIKKLENVIKRLDDTKRGAIEFKEIQDVSGVLLKDSGIKTRIIRRYIPIINKLINKYLAAMSFYINFEIDENFKETIKSTYRDEFTYQSFSEGEKLRINLAILFTWRAVAKMRNSMSTNLLILDEIFDSSLDNIGVDDFLKIIEDLGGDTNIFIISHKDSLYDKFHSAIKFTKHKNFSRIEGPAST